MYANVPNYFFDVLYSLHGLLAFRRQVETLDLDLLEEARQTKIPVTRDVLRSFGRAAKATLLADTAMSEAERARVEDFKAGEKWAKNFVKRNNIKCVRLHGQAGSVDKEAIKQGMEEVRALCVSIVQNLHY